MGLATTFFLVLLSAWEFEADFRGYGSRRRLSILHGPKWKQRSLGCVLCVLNPLLHFKHLLLRQPIQRFLVTADYHGLSSLRSCYKLKSIFKYMGTNPTGIFLSEKNEQVKQTHPHQKISFHLENLAIVSPFLTIPFSMLSSQQGCLAGQLPPL